LIHFYKRWSEGVSLSRLTPLLCLKLEEFLDKMLSKHFASLYRTHLLQSQLPSLSQIQKCSGAAQSSTTSPTNTITDIKIINGLPHITVPLPSRDEKCVFALKPISNSVGDFLEMLKDEDKGIDRAVIKNLDGVRISSRTSIQTLFDQSFFLKINNQEYSVTPPQLESLSKEELKKISDVKHLVSQLYEALNIEEFQLSKEQELTRELEVLQKELQPLEKQRQEIIGHAEERTTAITWVGLGLMSVQFGILARLTWWEYSWDIMEPVTYFVTYGTAIAGYAYFVLTRQEYLYPDATDRQRLMTFHKKAKKHRWDVDKYNTIKQGINAVEADLRKLRDPLQMHLGTAKLEERAAAQKGVGGLFGISSLKDVISKLQ